MDYSSIPLSHLSTSTVLTEQSRKERRNLLALAVLIIVYPFMNIQVLAEGGVVTIGEQASVPLVLFVLEIYFFAIFFFRILEIVRWTQVSYMCNFYDKNVYKHLSNDTTSSLSEMTISFSLLAALKRHTVRKIGEILCIKRGEKIRLGDNINLLMKHETICPPDPVKFQLLGTGGGGGRVVGNYLSARSFRAFVLSFSFVLDILLPISLALFSIWVFFNSIVS